MAGSHQGRANQSSNALQASMCRHGSLGRFRAGVLVKSVWLEIDGFRWFRLVFLPFFAGGSHLFSQKDTYGSGVVPLTFRGRKSTSRDLHLGQPIGEGLHLTRDPFRSAKPGNPPDPQPANKICGGESQGPFKFQKTTKQYDMPHLAFVIWGPEILINPHAIRGVPFLFVPGILLSRNPLRTPRRNSFS